MSQLLSVHSNMSISSPVCVCVFSGCLEKKTAEGNTPLHYCALYNKSESLKLLLKAKAGLHTGKQQSHKFMKVLSGWIDEWIFCSH